MRVHPGGIASTGARIMFIVDAYPFCNEFDAGFLDAADSVFDCAFPDDDGPLFWGLWIYGA